MREASCGGCRVRDFTITTESGTWSHTTYGPTRAEIERSREVHEWGVETFDADFQRVTVGPLPEADARTAATLRFDGVLMQRPVGSEVWEVST